MTMKEMLRERWKHIERVLDLYAVEPLDRYAVKSAFSTICWLYCQSNAITRVFEERVMREDKDLYIRCANPRENVSAMMKIMGETWPEELNVKGIEGKQASQT